VLLKRASARRSVFGVCSLKKQMPAAHGARGTEDGADGRIAGNLCKSSAAQLVLDLAVPSRRRVALLPISLNSFVFAAASRHRALGTLRADRLT